MTLSQVHSPDRGPGDQRGTVRTLNPGLFHRLFDSDDPQQGCPRYNTARRKPQSILELLIGHIHFPARKFGMGGLKMPEPPDTAFSGDQGTQCLVLPHPDGGDDPGSCYGNPREHLLRLVSLDILGHCPDGLEDLLALGRILQLDAVVLLQKQHKFQSVNGVQSKALSEERCVSVYVLRFEISEFESLDDPRFNSLISASIFLLFN